jgi:hypothetical protein
MTWTGTPDETLPLPYRSDTLRARVGLCEPSRTYSCDEPIWYGERTITYRPYDAIDLPPPPNPPGCFLDARAGGG